MHISYQLSLVFDMTAGRFSRVNLFFCTLTPWKLYSEGGIPDSRASSEVDIALLF